MVSNFKVKQYIWYLYLIKYAYGVSEFTKRKALYLFDIYFDCDHNGSIDGDLVIKNVDRIAGIRGWKSIDSEYRDVLSNWNTLWTKMVSQMDCDGDEKIFVNEWLISSDKYASAADINYDSWQTYHGQVEFKYCDINGNGNLTKEEFVATHKPPGVARNEVLSAFVRATEGEGFVGLQKYLLLRKEYYSTDDRFASGNFIMGSYEPLNY